VLAIETRLAFDLRATWQARVLLAAQEKTDGVIGAVTLSVLAHNFDDAMLPLLQLLFPGFDPSSRHFARPQGRSGAVVARRAHGQDLAELYSDEIALDFRRLADDLKLRSRRTVWVVADRRLDPTMDPQDPDAKRLVH
jgi:hypothetical protein